MPLFEAVRLALGMIRAQKLKSFFSLLGVKDESPSGCHATGPR